MADLIEEIRKPISEETPCGQNVLHDEDFKTVKTEIDKSNTADRANVDWKSVVELSEKILAQKSKDMQVASYLCLGLLRQEGFAGLAQGLEGYKTLLNTHWDGLFPLLRRRKPILDFLDDRASTFVENLNVSVSDGEALQKIDAAITAINEEVKDKLPQSPMVLLKLHQVIKKRLDAVKPAAESDSAEDKSETQTENNQLQLASVATTGPIRSRAEAYEQLSEIADYLAKIEPHSPTPYLVRRAVTWGDMSLAELLQELVRDNPQGLKAIYTLLGIPDGPASRPPPQPPSREQPSSRSQPSGRS